MLEIDHPQANAIREAIINNPIKNFSFLAVGTAEKDTNEAILWTLRDEDKKFTFHGGEVNGTRYKGILELIADYRWHQEQDYWELPRILVKNEGKLELDLKYD